jgi:AraC-like DNA-binding protein
VEGETRAVLGLALRRRAEMLLEQHFHDPAFGVQELAGLLGLSRSALYRLFGVI